MSAATDFDDMLNQTVTVRSASAKNSDGSQTFSTAATSYPARVVGVNKQTRDADGVVTQITHIAYVASTAVLSPTARFALPDGSTPPVLTVDTYPDESGNYVNTVRFGYR